MLIHAPAKGIALKLISTFTFACMFALLRLAEGLPPGEQMFFRSGFALGFIILWGVSLKRASQLLRVERKGLVAFTALLSATSMFVNLVALTNLPLAIFTTLTFLAPLFAVLIAAILLKEVVGLHRWLGLMVGFGGAVLVASQGNFAQLLPSLMSLGSGFAILGALMAGAYFVLVRRMSASEEAATMSFFFVLASTIFGAFCLGFAYVPPTPMEWLVLFGAGFFGAVSQMLLNLCYRFAEPSLLAPYEYAAIIWATILGLWLFGEFPTPISIVGIALVVLAGMTVAWGDARRSAAARAL